MPAISVIVPVYKVEPYIHRCVDSILAQTYADFELILVDDGSPDNCGAICDEYAEKDSRIHVIHQENGGLSAARNAGLDWVFANSDSEWISFIDSDDWVHCEYLEKMLDVANKQNVDLVFCGLNAFVEDNLGYKEVPFWGKPCCKKKSGLEILDEIMSVRDGLCSGHYVIACNKLYSKSIFWNLRYPKDQVHEDEAIVHRVLGVCKNVTGISERLYFYRQRLGSITQKRVGCYRDLCISLAYGDRILYCQEKNIAVANKLVGRYLKTLVRCFCEFYDEENCLKLLRKIKRQMRKVVACCRNADFSITKKVGIRLFCLAPRLVSYLFCISVKVRGG